MTTARRPVSADTTRKQHSRIGYISVVEGRNKDLRLQEYGLVGPMLATFIASLAVRYRMSRPKIRELLNDWVGVSLSIGSIDRCIREVGIACAPVVEELIEEFLAADVIHLDETPWYEKGKFCWVLRWQLRVRLRFITEVVAGKKNCSI